MVGGQGRVNTGARGESWHHGEIVRVCLDALTRVDLLLHLVKGGIQYKTSERILGSVGNTKTFGYFFADMDMGTHNNTLFVELQFLGRGLNDIHNHVRGKVWCFPQTVKQGSRGKDS